MFKGLFLSVSILLAASLSFANAVSVVEGVIAAQQEAFVATAKTTALNWKIGEQNNYKMKGGLINGTSSLTVREEVAEGFWMDQEMNMGFLGKQNASVLIDRNTGEVLKMIVNGQEQAPPKQEVELISMEESSVTVPAGTFDAIHIKALDKTQNQEINQWVNPSQIPINGMLKSVSPSQMGKITMELTSFKKL